MTIPFFVGAFLLVGGLVFYVLHPVLTGTAAPLRREESEQTEAEARKRVALLGLRDVEYDYATGKLDDTDYRELRSELATEALEAMEAEESVGEGEAEDGDRGGYPAARSLDELEEEIARYRAALREGILCPSCRHLNDAGSRFCARCGSTLEEEGAEAVKSAR